MIDRKLNYGRHHIDRFSANAHNVQSILDIGAGAGTDLDITSRNHRSAELYAVEYYPPNVERLRQNNIQVFQCNIEQDLLPLPASSVDLVIANQILEHTKEIFWIMHEVTRVLRTGGSLIIGVPNLASLHNRLLLLLGKQPTQIKNHSAHIRGFTKGDILLLLEECFSGGYELRDFGGSNFYPFPPAIARPLADILPSMAWGIFLRLEKKREYHREFLDYPIKNRLETNFFLGSKASPQASLHNSPPN